MRYHHRAKASSSNPQTLLSANTVVNRHTSKNRREVAVLVTTCVMWHTCLKLWRVSSQIKRTKWSELQCQPLSLTRLIGQSFALSSQIKLRIIDLINYSLTEPWLTTNLCDRIPSKTANSCWFSRFNLWCQGASSTTSNLAIARGLRPAATLWSTLRRPPCSRWVKSSSERQPDDYSWRKSSNYSLRIRDWRKSTSSSREDKAQSMTWLEWRRLVVAHLRIERSFKSRQAPRSNAQSALLPKPL